MLSDNFIELLACLSETGAVKTMQHGIAALPTKGRFFPMGVEVPCHLPITEFFLKAGEIM